MGRRIADNLPHRRPIAVLEPASEGVGQELFGDGARKLLGLLEQQRSQARQPLDLRTAQRRSARVDWLARFINSPPPADDIEILQREPHRIDDRVTAGTIRIRAVLRQPLAYRLRHGAWFVLRQVGVYARRRRRYSHAKNVVQQK